MPISVPKSLFSCLLLTVVEISRLLHAIVQRIAELEYCH